MRLRRSFIGSLIGLSAITAGLLAPASAFAATTSPAASTVSTAVVCTDGRWPLAVQGVPTLFHAGAQAGDYIWHDANGWHLRVTHVGSTRAVFTGRIVSSAPMTARAIRLEGGDTMALSADRLTLTYRFYNYGAVDGIDFKTACARRLAFSGSLNGAKLPVGRIWIGHGNHHPLQNPFAITRIS
ncbi:MAG TPA: hypothetical protein VFY18_12510 [Candidatus Limnocylindrales bacterium]|nr:hypothetical protein [Candidatus Limnocylindrales bacterium]